jgi:hypothetical protein
MNKYQKLFDDFDLAIQDFQHPDGSVGFTTAEKFKMLNEYQNLLAERIEQSNNKQMRNAMNRTAMYELNEVFQDIKRSEKLKKWSHKYHRLVNMFCLNITSVDMLEHLTPLDIKVYDYLMSKKEDILEHSGWYYRVIPESIWLLKHMYMVTLKPKII